MKKLMILTALAIGAGAAAQEAEAPESGVPAEETKLLVPPSQDIDSVINDRKESSLKGWSFGLGAGVLGGGNLNVGYRIPYNPDNFWKNRFGFRADYNTWAPFKSSIESATNDAVTKEIDKKREGGIVKINDEIYAADAGGAGFIKGQTFGALVDFYPFSYVWGLGGFRISGGYYFGKTEIGANAWAEGISSEVPTDFTWEGVNIGGTTYTPQIDTSAFGIKPVGIDNLYLEPKLTLHSTGPYAGLGWDIGIFSGLKITFDAGVVFTKSHEVSIADNLDTLKFSLSSSTLTIDIDNDPNIPGAVLKEQVRNTIEAELGKHLAAADFERSGTSNITITNVSGLIENHRGAIDSALAEVRKERDEGIADANKELKDYGYFPMVKIGLLWRF